MSAELFRHRTAPELADMPARHIRYRMVAVTTLMSVLLYLDRFCISFAEVFIKEDLGLTDTQVGWMLSAFFWTYALGQVPCGWLADRFGARVMLTIYILLWSLFTGLTGAAGVFSALLAMRFGFGLGQAGAYPTSANLVSKWIPFSGRGSASSIIAFGGRMGGALAPLLTALLIVQFVPQSTSSLIQTTDLLNVQRLCYEMSNGRDPSHSPEQIGARDLAARTGKEMLARFSPEAAGLVEKGAIGYEPLLRRTAAATGRGSPEGVSTTEIDAFALAAALNQQIERHDLFALQDTKGLPLSQEAQSLLQADQQQLEKSQIQRLNRLILEAIYPESIKKVYGGGWRYVMLCYGVIGLFIAFCFWWVVRDRPTDHRSCNPGEIELIQSGRPVGASSPGGAVGQVPITRLLTSGSMWLNCLMQWCTNVGWVFLVTWLPRYLATVHQVPVEQRGLMAFIPLVVGWAGMLLGGRLTDFMVKPLGLRWGRVLPISLSRFLAMSAYLVCLFEPSPWMAVAAFSVVAFATDLGTGSVWAFMQDVGGSYVGSVLGWGNMWGNLGAAVTPPLLIWIVSSSGEWELPAILPWMVGEGINRNWNLAFLTCAAAFLIAGIAALGMNASVPIVPEDESEIRPA